MKQNIMRKIFVDFLFLFAFVILLLLFDLLQYLSSSKVSKCHVKNCVATNHTKSIFLLENE